MAKQRKPTQEDPEKRNFRKWRKAEEIIMQKFRKEEARYTRPAENSEAGIKECKEKLKDGKLCYCKERCNCRRCQARNKELDGHLCSLEDLKEDGGCVYGCSGCSECNPCY